MKISNEDRKLLLADLCARLPYKPMIWVFPQTRKRKPLSSGYIHHIAIGIADYKPYLRSLSDMSEDESVDFYTNVFKVDIDKLKESFDGNILAPFYLKDGKWYFELLFENPYVSDFSNITDWLNAHHFDYRGLIEKKLAIKAPKDMYNFN